MSRIGKQPIAIPAKVKVEVKGQTVHIEGPKGKLDWELPRRTSLKVQDGKVVVSRQGDDAQAKALHGLSRALVNNMVKGVSEGYSKKLELVGVGYRAALQGKDLNLTLGFSHPVVFKAPEGITIEVPVQTEIFVKGADKQRVGEVAAKIRAFRPPEPYKGKGVRYSGEHITLKEAKKA